MVNLEGSQGHLLNVFYWRVIFSSPSSLNSEALGLGSEGPLPSRGLPDSEQHFGAGLPSPRSGLGLKPTVKQFGARRVGVGRDAVQGACWGLLLYQDIDGDGQARGLGILTPTTRI